MIAFVSILVYIIVLFSLSTLLFFSLTFVLGTQEPMIAFLLTLIAAHLLLNTLGGLRKVNKY
ncbi:hypothetical protein SAMN04487943_102359 [Gracilibacillus orientalis]|uniref:Uncharacterized protein n=1 Tax=Gracilibacillus orientalis TaxID=334253 RepID=A0A1I4IY26_9BACI|nr:hypothetical protein SAMN04487943_102359 [Gracilibacillus orientalis]